VTPRHRTSSLLASTPSGARSGTCSAWGCLVARRDQLCKPVNVWRPRAPSSGTWAWSRGWRGPGPATGSGRIRGEKVRGRNVPAVVAATDDDRVRIAHRPAGSRPGRPLRGSAHVEPTSVIATRGGSGLRPDRARCSTTRPAGATW
jgi:hypothetical protein